jgi:ribonucleoside-diphosphate reductase alpha chain
VQPFLSGAISKTVNMPCDATVEDIERVYLEAWKLGLKAVAIYRDGCKRTQPLNTGREKATDRAAAGPAAAVAAAPAPAPWPVRRRLPDERHSLTHKFSIGGHEGYVTAGLYEDYTVGEIFIVMAKEGSVISGMVDSFATAVSLALQYGVPLRVLVDKFVNVRFEPSGITANPDIRFAKSVTDYVFKWLALKFIPDHPVLAEVRRSAPEKPGDAVREAMGGTPASASAGLGGAPSTHEMMTDAPTCPDCGALMIRNASCYRCFNCGTTNGCS